LGSCKYIYYLDQATLAMLFSSSLLLQGTRKVIMYDIPQAIRQAIRHQTHAMCCLREFGREARVMVPNKRKTPKPGKETKQKTPPDKCAAAAT